MLLWLGRAIRRQLRTRLVILKFGVRSWVIMP